MRSNFDVRWDDMTISCLFLQNTPTPSRVDITDNLLNIPGKKRKTAADFF